jgi:hypothetical protein
MEWDRALWQSMRSMLERLWVVEAMEWIHIDEVVPMIVVDSMAHPVDEATAPQVKQCYRWMVLGEVKDSIVNTPPIQMGQVISAQARLPTGPMVPADPRDSIPMTLLEASLHHNDNILAMRIVQ